MFLNELNKEEAIAFINLVSQFANIDNEFAKEEKQVIGDYLKELSIEKEEIGSLSLEDEIATLKVSSDRVKRIVYFELVGLALVDGEYEEHEVDFLDNIAEALNITRAQKIAIANFFYNFTDIYNFATVEASDKIKLLKEQAERIIA